MGEKLLYRPEEAAERLSTTRTRIYELMAAGELDSVKIGRSRRIAAAELDAFVARLSKEQGSPDAA